MYIRAFQQASDLDDSVEDKLLIGDRPKPSNDPENQQPLRERLIKKKDEEVEDVCIKRSHTCVRELTEFIDSFPRMRNSSTSMRRHFQSGSVFTTTTFDHRLLLC